MWRECQNFIPSIPGLRQLAAALEKLDRRCSKSWYRVALKKYEREGFLDERNGRFWRERVPKKSLLFWSDTSVKSVREQRTIWERHSVASRI